MFSQAIILHEKKGLIIPTNRLVTKHTTNMIARLTNKYYFRESLLRPYSINLNKWNSLKISYKFH